MTKFDELANRFGGNPPDLTVKDAAGAAANTNIAIAGITKDDILITVLSFAEGATAGDAFRNDTANASVTSAGNLQITVDTTGRRVLVVFWDLAS